MLQNSVMRLLHPTELSGMGYGVKMKSCVAFQESIHGSLTYVDLPAARVIYCTQKAHLTSVVSRL